MWSSVHILIIQKLVYADIDIESNRRLTVSNLHTPWLNLCHHQRYVWMEY